MFKHFHDQRRWKFSVFNVGVKQQTLSKIVFFFQKKDVGEISLSFFLWVSKKERGNWKRKEVWKKLLASAFCDVAF